MDRVAALHAARRCNLPKTQYALPGPQTFVNLDMVDDVLGVGSTGRRDKDICELYRHVQRQYENSLWCRKRLLGDSNSGTAATWRDPKRTKKSAESATARKRIHAYMMIGGEDALNDHEKKAGGTFLYDITRLYSTI